jgi:hypothetical protein
MNELIRYSHLSKTINIAVMLSHPIPDVVSAAKR